MSYQLQFHTFGCKLNFSDTEHLQNRWLDFKKQNDSATDLNVHVLNTCAVTGEATKSATRMARQLKAKDPLCRVVMTGCAAQVDTEILQNSPGVDLVVANSHKSQLFTIMDTYFKSGQKQNVFKDNIFLKRHMDLEQGLSDERTRVFLKIQDGCNSFCSFCIIPFARGRSRSVPIRDLVEQVNSIHALGVKEIVLTGVHIGDYEDNKLRLEDLVEALLAKTTIPRIRLTSLEPPEITERLLDAFQDPRLCPHIHVSLQSLDTTVLSDMRRTYDAGHAQDALERIALRMPHAFVGMDLIVGFPTETAERFNNTLERLQNSPWTRVHVFPYSEREGTKALKFAESVPVSERRVRAKLVRQLSQERWQQMAQKQVGQTLPVLILQKPSKGADALSRNYWPVRIQHDNEVNQEVKVKIISTSKNKFDDVILNGNYL